MADRLTRLRFFDPDGNELDTVIIYRDGNSASIPGRAVWVEVTEAEWDHEAQRVIDVPRA